MDGAALCRLEEAEMSAISKRTFVRLITVIGLGVLVMGTSLAQTPTSTWQQIKQRGELRIGVTPGVSVAKS